jgi:hypothetical protein
MPLDFGNPVRRRLRILAAMALLPIAVVLRGADLQVGITGFDQVRLEGSVNGAVWRQVLAGARPEHGLTPADLSGRRVGDKTGPVFADTLPVSLAEVKYRYTVKGPTGEVTASADTSPENWPEALLPQLVLPGKDPWIQLYRKAWELTWKHIVTSDALPSRFAYNDYPDNDTTYVWDSCFVSLFQRYAAVSGLHPGMATLDDFYAQETAAGYICRDFHYPTFQARSNVSKVQPSLAGTNPPLFAWAEWNYYLLSADRGRLARVLPTLIRHYDFIESFLQVAPGRYVWEHNGSGWDNILEVEKYQSWVELPALQGLAARHIAKIAAVVGAGDVQRRFEAEVEKKRAQMEPYWNPAQNWYCSLDREGRFTGKTLAGMWPVLAGLVPKERLALIVKRNLMNPERFLTEPMPLPTIAKDEIGYNPRGAYWLGGVWINMSLMTIRSLEENGYEKEAVELATRTLDGIAQVYQGWPAKPGTLWECYAPEYAAPASHKRHPELGSVRSDFAGFTCGLINLLVENILGLQVNAPANEITWSWRLPGTFGIERLRFGATTTSLLKEPAAIVVQSDRPYQLIVVSAGQVKRYRVEAGANKFAW